MIQHTERTMADDLVLYIANKNYSSWSFRPWIAMTAVGIPFREELIPFGPGATHPRFRELSPTGKVPVLHHGPVRVWESLAIIEYVAELYPDAGLWPADRESRSLARSISMEMLSGFRALRSACPMNDEPSPAREGDSAAGGRDRRCCAHRGDLARDAETFGRAFPVRCIHGG